MQVSLNRVIFYVIDIIGKVPFSCAHNQEYSPGTNTMPNTVVKVNNIPFFFIAFYFFD